jgi:hypothetical protein
MFTGAMFIVLAVLAVTQDDAVWATPVNTALLVVLAWLSYYNEKRARADRDRVAGKVDKVAEKLPEPRDPAVARTRRDDYPPDRRRHHQ